MKDYVYVMGCQNDDHHKIGISDNPESRRPRLQGGASRRLIIIAKRHRPNRDALSVERVAHSLLHDHRAIGEWYAVSAADAVAAVDRAIQIVDSDDFSVSVRSDSVGARLRPGIKEGMIEASKKLDRSFSWIMNQACSDWLAKWRQQSAASIWEGDSDKPADGRWAKSRKNS